MLNSFNQALISAILITAVIVSILFSLSYSVELVVIRSCNIDNTYYGIFGTKHTCYKGKH